MHLKSNLTLQTLLFSSRCTREFCKRNIDGTNNADGKAPAKVRTKDTQEDEAPQKKEPTRKKKKSYSIV